MQQHDWERIKEIFTGALECSAPDRAEFLARECGTSELLRREVASLLAAHDEPQNLLEQNTLDLATHLKTEEHKYRGRIFGHYRILGELGRGGMGAVFLAERADGDFQQQVALKIIRQSFADHDLEKYFRRERQILASLNHPHIAKLIDGGVSENGELFLAMEFVEGEPLTSFAESCHLTIEERLQLFLKICRAVSFAHQNLVIHRDLKPSNILVTADGTPKLLDFGLAKLAQSPTGDVSLANADGVDNTDTAFRAFTPAYAAPEQILGKNVTTVSDVFSLGVILYELLINQKPFHFEGKSLDEIIRTATTGEPSLPSRALNSENPLISARQRQLKGDLDNITLKALQKTPQRRYQSVAELADDLERHLEHKPISARPNTLGYRASRFYQRNRIAVSAAVLIIVALIGGLGIALWQNNKARRENARAEATNAFLQRMIETPTSQSGNGQSYQTTVNEILADAEKRLDEPEMVQQPEVRAKLREIVGRRYLEVGNYAAAEKALREAQVEQTQVYGEGSPKLLVTEFELAQLFLAKADYESAEKIYTQRFAFLRTEFQHRRIEARDFIVTLNGYALLRRARGDAQQAEALLRESLAVSAQYPSAGSSDLARGFLTLILLDQGKFDEAEVIQQGVVGQQRKLANNQTPDFSAALTLLGSILMEKGDLSGAEANLREAEGIYRKLFGPTFIPLFDNLRLQAQVSYLAGKYPEAEAQISEVLNNYRLNSNPKYISFATALTVQGLILNKLGRSVAAEKVLREAVKLREENLPPKHFMTALTRGALGECLTILKRYDEAEPLLLASYQNLKDSQGPTNPRTKIALQRLVTLYLSWGRESEASSYRSQL